MKTQTMILVLMVFGLLIAGCANNSSPPSGYSNYGAQGGGQQQYVGGGCGLASAEPKNFVLMSDREAAPSV